MSRPTCDTPGCGRTIPVGGEGHPEICPKCLIDLDRSNLRAENAKLRARLDEAHEIMRAAPIKEDQEAYFERWHARANKHLSVAPSADSLVAGEPCPSNNDHRFFCTPCDAAARLKRAESTPDNGMLAPVWAKLDKLEKSDVWLAAQVKVTDDYNTEMFAKFQLLERRFVDLDALAAQVTELEARLKKVEKQDHAYEYDPAVGGCKHCGGPTNAIHTAYPTSIPNTAAPSAPVAKPVKHICLVEPCTWENHHPKPETAGPGPHEYNASGPVAICWEPTGRPNDVCGRFKDDPIHAHAKDVER